MNEIQQTSTIVFSTLVLLSLLSFGWKSYEQAKEEAETRQFCQQLSSFRSEVVRRIENGEQVSDLERIGAYRAGKMIKECP